PLAAHPRRPDAQGKPGLTRPPPPPRPPPSVPRAPPGPPPLFAAAGLVNAVGVGTVAFATALGVLPFLLVVGRAADRIGARRVLVAAALARAACFALFSVRPPLSLFVVLCAVLALGNRVEQAAFPMMAATLAPEGHRDRWLATWRAMFNIGVGAGSLLAGAALASHADFQLLGWANALVLQQYFVA
ncbi:MFS transporter, partial [Streptomyces sp. NPDC056160]|uniref:MFS transporter n=1 Tax=Streptomyces sp. NPDC056160 TaxID=3345731 RepID=UPI0035DF9C49